MDIGQRKIFWSVDGERTPRSVLSVDDAQEIREMLHEVIRHLGHTSVAAANGIDAIEKLGENHFDIVIADINAPRLDGVGLIKRIAADFRETDVIAVTGFQTKYNYTDIIALGASDFISKPINIDELEAKIKRIIRERVLRTELKRLSIHDALTGLYNRRYFDENLKREAIRAFRQQYGLYLFLIDIDNFKTYNDKFGHSIGDELLKELAQIISRNIRMNVDSGYRYGGDEFAVTLLHATHDQAFMVAERIRNEYNGKELEPTSLSIGIARFQDSPEALEENLKRMVREADEALYLAKDKGGNQDMTLDLGTQIQPSH